MVKWLFGRVFPTPTLGVATEGPLKSASAQLCLDVRVIVLPSLLQQEIARGSGVPVGPARAAQGLDLRKQILLLKNLAIGS